MTLTTDIIAAKNEIIAAKTIGVTRLTAKGVSADGDESLRSLFGKINNITVGPYKGYVTLSGNVTIGTLTIAAAGSSGGGTRTMTFPSSYYDYLPTNPCDILAASFQCTVTIHTSPVQTQTQYKYLITNKSNPSNYASPTLLPALADDRTGNLVNGTAKTGGGYWLNRIPANSLSFSTAMYSQQQRTVVVYGRFLIIR